MLYKKILSNLYNHQFLDNQKLLIWKIQHKENSFISLEPTLL